MSAIILASTENMPYEDWLEVSIYDVSEDVWVYLSFVPADMTICPYDNPYYVG